MLFTSWSDLHLERQWGLQDTWIVFVGIQRNNFTRRWIDGLGKLVRP